MNQEKEWRRISNSAGEYFAPSIKVIEIKARRVICQSPNFTSTYNEEDDLG